jgi:pyruvate dehydrogenase E2 component (dihydrolipoamide acetyltransferase)
MLFLHGLGGAQTTWANVLGEFADTYRVAAFDLPGHGASDKAAPDRADYSIPGLASAVAQAIEKLELAPVILVGHSLGGAVALQIALERPKLVRGLVLIGSVGLGPEISEELLENVAADPSRDEARRLLELFFENHRFILERGVDDMYAARTASGADAAMKAVAASAFTLGRQQVGYLDRLGEIEVPLFFVWGELDRVIPARHAVAAAAAVPTSWLEIMEGVGHVPQVEAAPALAAVVNRWVASLPRS